jgi:hypothetical protein
MTRCSRYNIIRCNKLQRVPGLQLRCGIFGVCALGLHVVHSRHDVALISTLARIEPLAAKGSVWEHLIPGPLPGRRL